MNIRFWGVRGSLATPLTNKALEAKVEAAMKLGIKAGLSDENQVWCVALSKPTTDK